MSANIQKNHIIRKKNRLCNCYSSNLVSLGYETKCRLYYKFDCKQILKGLFLNPLTAAIELKFNKTQRKVQNPLKSQAERNVINKYAQK